MEPLTDPLNDRLIRCLPPPPHKPLTSDLLFDSEGNPNLEILKNHLSKEGRINKKDFLKMMERVAPLLKKEGNLLLLEDPVTIVGDIHGQFYDLLNVFEIGGSLAATKYIFLGDYVNRGVFSIEVLCLLFATKICFPNNIFLLRGNHESRQMTSFLNFRDECLFKFDQSVYELIMDVFDLLPLACLVNGKYLSVHGGISPNMFKLEDLDQVDRFMEPPRQGIICDLLWSDPIDNEIGNCEGLFLRNEVRACSFYYGLASLSKFLQANNLLCLIRAHEAQIDGYKMHKWYGITEFPPLITLFSAPNYCDTYNNKAAIIKIDNDDLNILQFNYSPHPYWLPNFTDVFTWSLPFIAEHLNHMMVNILNKGDDEDSSDEENNYKITNKEILKNKVRFISKMAVLQKNLRKNNENLVKPKSFSLDLKYNRLEQNVSNNGMTSCFKLAKKADQVNDKMPC